MVQMKGVSKRLGGMQVLNGVALHCGPSEVVAITGENGAGKSTLLRVLVGILEADRGEVLIGGAPIGASAARRRLGYVPDATDPLPEISVGELIALVCALKGVAIASLPEDRIERLGVRALWQQRLGTLSLGQRKRACLVAALAGAPPLLVLDEPTNGLDPDGARLILELIEARRGGGEATLLATNDPAFLHALGASHYHLRGGQLQRVA